MTIIPRIQNEIEDERIDEKFSRVFEGNMRFFFSSKEDNEIEEDDER